MPAFDLGPKLFEADDALAQAHAAGAHAVAELLPSLALRFGVVCQVSRECGLKQRDGREVRGAVVQQAIVATCGQGGAPAVEMVRGQQSRCLAAGSRVRELLDN